MTEKDWLNFLAQGPPDEFLGPMRDWFLENGDQAGVAFVDWVEKRTAQIKRRNQEITTPWVHPLGYPKQETLWWWRDEGRSFDDECQNTLPREVFDAIGPEHGRNPQKSRVFPTELDAWIGLLAAWRGAYKT